MLFSMTPLHVLNDGQLLAAAEEERFTNVKHGKRPVPFSTYELPIMLSIIAL